MKFAISTKVIGNYKGSDLASSERNDCSVRAFAGLLDTQYEPAHAFVKDRFCRKDKQGVAAMPEICRQMSEKEETYSIDGVNFNIEYLSDEHITNQYKLKGEIINRKKTVKSFVHDHEEGFYLVFVSGHVFAVKDGTIIDNESDEYRPTRKVLGAVKVIVQDNQQTFDLF